MDARQRKNKFNSISSILSKPNASSTSKGFGCRVRFPIYSCAFVKRKEEDDGDEGEIKGMEVVSFKEVKREEEKRREELRIESEACGNKIGEEKSSYMSEEISNKISVSSGTCFLLFLSRIITLFIYLTYNKYQFKLPFFLFLR
jgi:hypothetical protein